MFQIRIKNGVHNRLLTIVTDLNPQGSTLILIGWIRTRIQEDKKDTQK